ncbi:glycosyltransferase family 1 protein [Pontibacter qinzhouensis]|uniref:Glycosyltransferase family 1 protein n=1 Tax=Pontibacter qinzhouensis TaxID=2603253 RepID=A0A5C8KBI4_9BACT|nr:glycosyltransferase [Pontibacter qinzhouensis]TXK46972.1 glycosyltransferase family 1 protein [Pontibacter qinzhouensis]
MAHILYIGQYTAGSTSRMRADKFKSLLPDHQFHVINSDIPFYECNKFSRSIGFRFKVGPLISSINNYIKCNVKELAYKLIWIDKGIFINKDTLKFLKARTSKLIHYTPDTAFFQNKSFLFESGIHYYDLLITTKSFDKENYLKLVNADKLIFTTQGFDKTIHKPYHSFYEKEKSIVFIGLCEPSRERILTHLLNAGLSVKLAGYGWSKFLNSNHNNLKFLGEKLVGEEYAKAISGSLFGFGALSKKFPELHTTRTFEIPACGTALLTEANFETNTFFKNDEAIFYKNISELISKIKYYSCNLSELQVLTDRGYKKVMRKYEYGDLLQEIVKEIIT